MAVRAASPAREDPQRPLQPEASVLRAATGVLQAEERDFYPPQAFFSLRNATVLCKRTFLSLKQSGTDTFHVDDYSTLNVQVVTQFEDCVNACDDQFTSEWNCDPDGDLVASSATVCVERAVCCEGS